MNDRCDAPPARCLAVWLTVTAGVAGAGWLLTPDLVGLAHAAGAGGLASQPFTRLLEWSCALAAALATSWLWLVTGVVALHAARGARAEPLRGVPTPVRRLLLTACGVALTGGLTSTALASPSLATPGALHRDRTGATAAALLQGLPLPDRPTGGLPGGGRITSATAHPPGPARVGGQVTVRVGDSLWRIAERTLPPDSSDAAVEACWQRIYALNRAVIGSDPDLVRPGTTLRLPRPLNR
ncbi:LysM peptidoglycan-binding domain-containing protein [Nocardioides sp. MAHUQ-72]|uniref:LysM peptidoglycan-binding domain-containing protein n=1 Tax=unclassified Nocardioides TaxID=2615069 RepID=UPI00360ABE2E